MAADANMGVGLGGDMRADRPLNLFLKDEEKMLEVTLKVQIAVDNQPML